MASDGIVTGEGGEDLALAELDSVLNSYHSSSSGAGGVKSSGEKIKKNKRSKDGHGRGGGGGGHSGADGLLGNAYKSGGTWPRTRGGPIIDHGTGMV